MAKNIQIKRYNGSSWDVVYPKTDWSLIENKPSTYTPSSHTHSYLPLSGGTLTDSDDTPLVLRTTNQNASGTWIAFRSPGDTFLGSIGVSNDSNAVLYTIEGGTQEIALRDDLPTNEAAANGGTDVSLVTTGDKYNWNNMLPLSGGGLSGGVNIGGAAAHLDLRARSGATDTFVVKVTSLNTAQRTLHVQPDETAGLAGGTKGVIIGGSVENTPDTTYKLKVVGSANATTLYENGTALSSKYLQLSGGTLTGNLTMDTSKKINLSAAGINIGAASSQPSYTAGDLSRYNNYLYLGTDGTTAGTKRLAYASELSSYLPLSGGTLYGTNYNILTIKRNNSSYGAYIDFKNKNQDTNYWTVGMNSSDKFSIGWKGSETTFAVDSNGKITSSGGTLGYGGTGSSDSSISAKLEIDGGILRIKNYGTSFDIGSLNSLYVHFQNDQSKHYYFNNPVTIDGNLYPYSNNDKNLGLSTRYWANIYGTTIYSDTMVNQTIYGSNGHLGLYGGGFDTRGISIYDYDTLPKVQFTTNGGTGYVIIGDDGGGESSGGTHYIQIGNQDSFYYNESQNRFAELRFAAALAVEGSGGNPYVAIRPNKTSGGLILNLPAGGDGETKTLATTSDIPAVLPAQYLTTPPTSANTTGIKFVLLNSNNYPQANVTKYNGYVYMWY